MFRNNQIWKKIDKSLIDFHNKPIKLEFANIHISETRNRTCNIFTNSFQRFQKIKIAKMEIQKMLFSREWILLKEFGNKDIRVSFRNCHFFENEAPFVASFTLEDKYGNDEATVTSIYLDSQMRFLDQVFFISQKSGRKVYLYKIH